MEEYPKTIMEFREYFSTEDACRKYLEKIRWPDDFRCPHCGYDKAWETQRGLYRCSHCDIQTSVTVGTVFHGTRKPLRLWFEAIWHITSQKYGANALGLQRILGLGSYHTAWIWLHKLRRAMVRPGRECLSGLVEVDETYIGGEKQGKRGRGAAYKALVLIAVEDKGEEGFGRIRIKRVKDASNDSLIQFIQDNIEIGSNIRTDGWNGYNQLSSKGYGHIIVKQNASMRTDELPIVHRIASLLKRWLLGTYQGAVRPSYLDYYLDEYTFRFNRRKSTYRGKLFYRLIEQAVLIDKIYGRDIQGDDKNLDGIEWSYKK
jgi:transposase-like protein